MPYPIDSYTKLLCHFDGADGSTSDYTAETGQTVSLEGTAQLDTAQSKFGGSSLLLDGNSDYATVPDSADWYFDGDFTIDCWVRRAASAAQAIFGQSSGVIDNTFLTIEGNKLRYVVLTAGSHVVDSAHSGLVGSATLASDTWYHVAVVRSGNNFYLFVNGVLDGSWTGAATLVNYTSLFYIGVGFDSGPFYYFNGWIEEFRVSKGIARWTSNFNPPGRPYGYANKQKVMVV